MIQLIKVVALVSFVSWFSNSTAHADGLKSDQIKALLSGNTLFHDRPNARGRARQAWLTFKPDGTFVYKTIVEGRRQTNEMETESKWQVKAGGIVCWLDRNDQEGCLSNLSLKGDTMSGKSARTGDTLNYQLQKAK